MTHVLRCGCGLKFETKGLAVGSRQRCPMCGRDLVVPARAPSPSAWSRIGRSGRIAAVLGGVTALALAATGGAALALSGVLGGSKADPKPVETASQPPAPSHTADPKPFEYERETPRDTAEVSGTGGQMPPIAPVDTTAGLGGLMPPPQ